ncbi:MAG: MFS transporter [Clostridia bacterium]|nr:MFS transporter [Clostridia bacterium]
MTKSKKFWVALVLFSLIGQVAWVVENMYFNVFIYKMFSASASQISLMVSLSAVTATLTTIFIGALSDKVGKRKIFIGLGYILWGISILLFALVKVDIIGAIFPTAVSVSALCITFTIILDCVMTFFGSTANDACFNAWLTDSTEDTGRGKVEGINAMMPLMAIIVVFGGFMFFDLEKAQSWTLIFVIIGAVVILIGALSFFLIEEPQVKKDGNENYFKNIIYGFKPSTIKSNLTLYATILAFAVFGISIQIFMPYLIIYYEVSLSLENYVLIMAPAIIIAGIVTAFYGRYYDKVGFFPSIIPALISLAVGYIVLSIFTQVALVFIGSLLMMIGYLTGMAVFGAMIRDYTPQGKAGALQGIRIVGQVLIPGVIGPAIGALVLKSAETIIGNDGTETFIPNQNIFIAALVVCVLVVGLTFLVRYLVNKNKAKEETK